MSIHPVNLVIFLSVLVLGSLVWILISARRRRIARAEALLAKAQAEALVAKAHAEALAGAPDLASLRRRVAVLEQIVTDPGTHLNREIEDLRSAG